MLYDNWNIFQLVGQYDVVVNCTGLGSMGLLGDEKLIPNRGHLIKVSFAYPFLIV